MPLRRASVTIASRVMLPAYFVFALWVGICYTADPDHRLSAVPPFPLFAPLVWGIGFLAFAGGLLLALLTNQRTVYVGTLALMMTWLALWALGLLKGAFLDGDATFTAWLFPAFIATACWATMLSLLTQEETR